MRKEIAKTRKIFAEYVWPIWQESLGASGLISTEGSERELEREADFSGVDAFFALRNNGALIPIASRVEYAHSPNIEISRSLDRSFTIRSEKWDGRAWHDNTELNRLVVASTEPVSRRYLPFRTIQSLVKLNDSSVEVLFSSSVCTDELADYIRMNAAGLKSSGRLTKSRDAKFVRINIASLQSVGIRVETWPENKSGPRQTD